ncbi:MAG: hypothetical protein WCG25_01770 [bacterium]
MIISGNKAFLSVESSQAVRPLSDQLQLIGSHSRLNTFPSHIQLLFTLVPKRVDT